MYYKLLQTILKDALTRDEIFFTLGREAPEDRGAHARNKLANFNFEGPASV